MGDRRITIDTKQDFIPVIKKLMERNEQASILYDDGGVTRASGIISSFNEAGPDSAFVLDGSTTVKISGLIAVNGLFSGDYSEC